MVTRRDIHKQFVRIGRLISIHACDTKNKSVRTKKENRSLHSLVPRPYVPNYAHAVVACTSGKEGSGTKLYPNARTKAGM